MLPPIEFFMGCSPAAFSAIWLRSWSAAATKRDTGSGLQRGRVTNGAHAERITESFAADSLQGDSAYKEQLWRAFIEEREFLPI
jgi:hypothetical protein